MRVIRDYEFVEDKDKGASVAIGNFDGVHLGHQSVIDIALKEAKAYDAPLGILACKRFYKTTSKLKKTSLD